MKLTKNLRWSVITTVLPMMFLAASVHAHDPAEHVEGAETANCEMMKTMDHSKMDMNDSVAQAMMKKCMSKMHKMDSKGMHKVEKMDVNGDVPEKMYEGHSHQ
ncbi:MAG: hypothetical protein JKY50_18670 [Oleispira sp.]|nr:hypothetical protein [Oleispira sp.]